MMKMYGKLNQERGQGESGKVHTIMGRCIKTCIETAYQKSIAIFNSVMYEYYYHYY